MVVVLLFSEGMRRFYAVRLRMEIENSVFQTICEIHQGSTWATRKNRRG